MFQKISTLVLLSIINIACFANIALAQSTTGNNYFQAGLTSTSQSMGYTSPDLLDSISKIITLVLSLVGVIFLVLIIYGGINWMTAGGNETQVKNAQNTIGQAVIGLIIVLSAYAITYFIMQNLAT